DGLYDRLAKCRKVRASLGGKLPIDKGIIFFAVLVGMGESHFYIVAFQMDNGISSALLIQLPAYQIQQSFFGEKFLSVIVYGQSGIKKSVVPNLVFQIFGYKVVVFKYGNIWRKGDFRSPTVGRWFHIFFLYQNSLLKRFHFGSSIPVRLYPEIFRQ